MRGVVCSNGIIHRCKINIIDRRERSVNEVLFEVEDLFTIKFPVLNNSITKYQVRSYYMIQEIITKWLKLVKNAIRPLH